MNGTVKILVVDDDRDLCDLISDILIHSKYTTDRAYDYNRALKLIYENGYSLLITDNRLGTASGLDLVQFTRKKGHNLKAIIITAYGSDDVKEKAASIGVDYIIDKPFDVNDLVKKVKSCLESSMSFHA